jgi:flagellar M-ring protein FliF
VTGVQTCALPIYGASQDNAMGGVDERKTAFENRLRSQVEGIVTSVVGSGHARVQLTADFDLNRVTQTSDKFDPEGRVLRSSQTREETSNGENQGGAVSVGNELPGANRQEGGGNNTRDQNRKTEEITNYEISRTTKTEVVEAGRVNRISAAVLVDGNYSKNDKGEVVYQPRAKEEIDRIAALVRSAIGFDAKRGDQVEVVNLRFADTSPILSNEPAGWMSYLAFGKEDIMRGAEIGVMALLGLIVLFLVVRPLVRRIITPEGMQAGAAGMAGVAGAIGAADTAGNGNIATSGGANISIDDGVVAAAISNRTSAMIDVAKVQGQVHAVSVQKVGELAEKNPQEAVSIIRNWLHEDAA